MTRFEYSSIQNTVHGQRISYINNIGGEEYNIAQTRVGSKSILGSVGFNALSKKGLMLNCEVGLSNSSNSTHERRMSATVNTSF
jgi:hypothetical protein